VNYDKEEAFSNHEVFSAAKGVGVWRCKGNMGSGAEREARKM